LPAAPALVFISFKDVMMTGGLSDMQEIAGILLQAEKVVTP